jgi:hypothetical protein
MHKTKLYFGINFMNSSFFCLANISLHKWYKHHFKKHGPNFKNSINQVVTS